jgi:hypothetical protein
VAALVVLGVKEKHKTKINKNDNNFFITYLLGNYL